MVSENVLMEILNEITKTRQLVEILARDALRKDLEKLKDDLEFAKLRHPEILEIEKEKSIKMLDFKDDLKYLSQEEGIYDVMKGFFEV